MSIGQGGVLRNVVVFREGTNAGPKASEMPGGTLVYSTPPSSEVSVKSICGITIALK